MAQWQTPKTNWYGARDMDGVYTGDRFNASDFNRIRNNLIYLRDLAVKMYAEFTLEKVNDDKDKSPADFFYADEINALEKNLDALNKNTRELDFGEKETYEDNGPTMDYIELNRIEKATLDLYDRLLNQHEGVRRFTWNFGMKGGTL